MACGAKRAITGGSGSRPGTPSPLGLLDANGQIAGGASFTLPPGMPGLAGTQLHNAVVVFDGAFVNTYATEAAAVKFQ